MYPDAPGHLRFSRVGFDATGSKAVVHVELMCGPLCGEGYYVLLVSNGVRWEIVGTVRDLLI